MTFKPTLLSFEEAKAERLKAFDARIKTDVAIEGETFVGNVVFMPGYNDLHSTPMKYGQHGMDIEIALIGALGAITVGIGTGWTPVGHIDAPNLRQDGTTLDLIHQLPASIAGPRGNKVAFHWRTNDSEQVFGDPDPCGWLDDAPCYGGGSFIAADQIAGDFITFGLPKVWDRLHGWYRAVARGQEQA